MTPPERETPCSIALMLAFVIVAASDATWQRVKRLWKREKRT